MNKRRLVTKLKVQYSVSGESFWLRGKFAKVFTSLKCFAKVLPKTMCSELFFIENPSATKLFD